MIDWDTVGLAPPERDLWKVVSDSGGGEARRYTEVTGRPVDPTGLALYRIRWQLDDIAAFVHMFRATHGRTAEAEHMWQGMSNTLMRVQS